jgi:hypothetical protein
MIIKSIPIKGKAFSQLLNYMLHSGDRLTDAQGQSFILKRNLRGHDTDTLIREFHLNEEYREVVRANSNAVYHEIISFSDEDTPNLCIDILKDLTEEYINLRAPNSLVVATPHFDQVHRHVHLAISGIQYRTGTATRVSKKEFHSIKESLQTLQQERYPFLTHSRVEHGRKAKEAQLIKQSETQARKTLLAQLDSLMATASSKEEFLSRLQEVGLQTYTRGDNIKGIELGGKRYRFSTLGIEAKFQEWENTSTQHPPKEITAPITEQVPPVTNLTPNILIPPPSISAFRSQELRAIRNRGESDHRRSLTDRDQ